MTEDQQAAAGPSANVRLAARRNGLRRADSLQPLVLCTNHRFHHFHHRGFQRLW